MSVEGVRRCPFCGPRTVTVSNRSRADLEVDRPCPTCRLDPGEARSVQEVEQVGFVEAYRREWRRDHGLPALGWPL